MTEDYIIKNIYPMIRERQRQESRSFWVALITDPNNPHIHELAKERVKYIDEHPGEFPFPWMPAET